MKILVVGSGGREHALVWKLEQSAGVDGIYCAPGNAGTAEIAENVEIKASDLPGLARFAKENRIGLTVVGPDDPLAAGIVDLFEGSLKTHVTIARLQNDALIVSRFNAHRSQ